MSQAVWGNWECSQCGEEHYDPAFVTTHCRACGAVHAISEIDEVSEGGVEYVDVTAIYQGYSIPVSVAKVS